LPATHKISALDRSPSIIMALTVPFEQLGYSSSYLNGERRW